MIPMFGCCASHTNSSTWMDMDNALCLTIKVNVLMLYYA